MEFADIAIALGCTTDIQQGIFSAILGAGKLAVSTGLGKSAVRLGSRALGLGGKAARSKPVRVGLGTAGAAVTVSEGIDLVQSRVGRSGTGAVNPPGVAPISTLPGGGRGGSKKTTAMLAQAGALPLTLPVEYTPVAKPPRGYVLVDYDGQEMFMLKGCARDLGLWKARRKPPISASDYRTLMRAATTAKKIDRITKMADRVTGKKRTKTIRVNAQGKRLKG